MIKFQDWQKLARGYGDINNYGELVDITKYLSDMGYIRYYDAPNVAKYVILHPNIIMQIIGQLLVTIPKCFDVGFLTIKLSQVLKNFNSGEIKYFVHLLAAYRIIYLVDTSALIEGVAPTIECNKLVFFPYMLEEGSKAQTTSVLPGQMTQVASLEASMKDVLIVHFLENGWKATNLWKQTAILAKGVEEIVCIELEDTSLIISASEKAVNQVNSAIEAKQ
eukprot:CAMPEP_0168514650 /NCGR_PEP_ID=MMETSP0405-20121227/4247_1 /TAXON_ID=498012 /ORGANISM="Trichosphaerium sp, Strain Am-I-7 wt" /LENGTH=220 /DNA_ID=CAMNT_0008533839 /DNA_START=346 /DNA_END=1008 /DNA_ORIENTATION=+